MSFGKERSNPPAPPDPAKTIQAQADANRVTQFTPRGDLRYGTVGAGGQFIPGTGGAASQVTLTPEQQAALGDEQAGAAALRARALSQISQLPGQNISFEGLPEFTSNIDFSGVRPVPTADQFHSQGQDVEKATYDRMIGLLRPEFERSQENMNQQLANSGLPVSSAAYEGEQGRFQRGRDETLSRLAAESVLAGRQEEGRLFGQELAGRGAEIGDLTTNAALSQAGRQQGISERGLERGTLYNELAAMLGGQQIGYPGFAPPTPIDAQTPYQTAYAGQLSAYDAQRREREAALGGLFGLGQAGITAYGLSQ